MKNEDKGEGIRREKEGIEGKEREKKRERRGEI